MAKSKSKPSTKKGEETRPIGLRIKVLSQLLGRRLQSRLEPYGLTPVHWLVLNCLSREDGLPISALGDQLQQVGGTMTGVIDRMEERQLIRRERDPDDRRIWRAFLMPKGKELIETLPPMLSKNRQKLVRGIAASDYACFQKVLDKLIENAAEDLQVREE